MQTITSIIEELNTASRPVAKAIHKGEKSKAICIGFNKQMRLSEHRTHIPTTLLVLSGKIQYNEGEASILLKAFEQHSIPVDVQHSVDALEDSLILLVQG